jgi:hypothetical protein
MLILLFGCSVQSSQLTGLISLIKSPSLDLSANSWIVRYSDYESVVYAVSTNNGTLFSNKAGDRVLFDGWSIRKVRGLGSRRLDLTIRDDGINRLFYRGNFIVSQHICGDWQILQSGSQSRFFQRCSAKQNYENSILIDKDKSITLIRQIMGNSYSALTLTKIN